MLKEKERKNEMFGALFGICAIIIRANDRVIKKYSRFFLCSLGIEIFMTRKEAKFVG